MEKQRDAHHINDQSIKSKELDRKSNDADEENGEDMEEISVDDDDKNLSSIAKQSDNVGAMDQDNHDSVRNTDASANPSERHAQQERDNEDDEDQIDSLHYSAKSFTALLYPVSVTMIATSLCTIYINDGLNGKGTGSGAGGLPIVYTGDNDENLSTSEKLEQAVVNALAIIGAIIAATIVLLSLYYFKFYKTLFAYLIVTTAMVLGFSTGFIVQVSFFVYDVPFDSVSFAIIFWNIAITGVFAIFYQKGISHNVAQVYLIIISVTMAWLLLRYLPEWTSWTLLVALALYDLCAVLTPCGPLKWLVEIAQERKDPLPGLLYEAHVGERSTQQQPPQRNERQNNNTSNNAQQNTSTPRLELAEAGASFRSNTNQATNIATQSADMQTAKATNTQKESEIIIASTQNIPPARPKKRKLLDQDNSSLQQTESRPLDQSPSKNQAIVDNIAMDNHSDGRNSAISFTANNQNHENFQANSEEIVYDDELENRTIKLGLGDFVFYSVLVGRAALYSFTTFAAVYITVLSGLAMTLILLALFEQALPALPFSIILGVIFYFATEAVIMPFSSDMSSILVFV